MRALLSAALAASLAAGAAAAAEAPRPQPDRRPAAVAAERYATQAAYTERGHGYSARERHITNCLAAYPTYDWRTDRAEIRPGVVRRCNL